MILPVNIKNQSIDSSGITKDYKTAINEYVWNGFEANATKININYEANEAFGIKKISIEDNGYGIRYDDLEDTFGSFLTSRKNLLSLQIKSKANKGKGRFSFVAFSDEVQWDTIYKDGNIYKEYNMVMLSDKKDIINCSELKISNKNKTGTTVRFNNIKELTVEDMNFEILEPALLREFAWFLYLHKDRKLEILINGQKIDNKKYVNEQLSEKYITKIGNYKFEITLIIWKETIAEKCCCYYFDAKNILRKKETTTFNRNTIGFYHSVFIKSNFFDNTEHVTDDYESNQLNIFESVEDKKIQRELNQEIQRLIVMKKKVYLSDKADKAIEEMIEVKRTFPQFSSDPYAQMRKNDLKKVTKEIYKLEPKIFYNLKYKQEKSLLGFLNLLLNSEERENILTIIDQIVELSPQQRKDFSEILKKTSLENIIDTIKFIENRYKVIELLKNIVYDLTKFSNERNHVQKIVERHFWLFGEQYNLASADQRMKKALEKYRNILYGEDDITVALKPDAENERRIDIFLCNTRDVETTFETTLEENIIVELKAPRVILSKRVLRQIEDYMDYIRRQPQFNSEFRRWKFISVCNEIDEDIKSRYKAFEDKGKVGLVFQVENCEIYAFTWDDVFKRFEIRHKPMLERLKYDREQIAKELMEEVHNTEKRAKADALTEIAIAQV